MQLLKKVIGNTAAQVAAKIITALLAVLVVKILTVYLGKGGYGHYATIYEFIAFFGALADFGLFALCVREMGKSKAQQIFSNVISLRIVMVTMAMLIVSGAAWLIPAYQDTIIAQGVAIGALMTWLVIMAGTFSAGLQVKMKMHYAAISLVIGKIITTLLIIYLTAHGGSFFSLLWAGVLGAAVSLGLIAYFSSKDWQLKPSWQGKQMRNLFFAAAPFAVALILHTLYIRVDVFLLSVILPSSVDGVCPQQFCADTEVGMYAVAARLMEVALLTPLFFLNAVLPNLSAMRAKKQTKKVIKLMRGSLHLLLILGLLAGILVFSLRQEIVLIISSVEFLGGSDVALMWLAPVLPMAFIGAFFAYSLITFERQSLLVITTLLAVTINISGNLYVIPLYGLQGAAITSLISEVILLIAIISLSSYVLKINWLDFTLLKIILAGSLALFAAQITPDSWQLLVRFAATVVITPSIFAVSLYLLGVWKSEITRWRAI